MKHQLRLPRNRDIQRNKQSETGQELDVSTLGLVGRVVPRPLWRGGASAVLEHLQGQMAGPQAVQVHMVESLGRRIEC